MDALKAAVAELCQGTPRRHWQMAEGASMLLIYGFESESEARKLSAGLTSRGFLSSVVRGDKQGSTWTVSARHRVRPRRQSASATHVR
ncbi:MAG TPA: hypothetical protein PL151_03325 [Phycisphaerae bacterium]|mgnify:CR=1 FL=1|nr:hypothetical protein [Phycisphaerae bacterium]HOM49650.1 hypothetical protein [Phycisphaerae bacterium]HON65085.1 hypothetical protein [Phycisphaerae bacterium]HOQ84092.1 hypothetical protein [Phycisphaerae bacterium]HPP25019.1 hypothetical protein [Phycisphaerae bacterium]